MRLPLALLGFVCFTLLAAPGHAQELVCRAGAVELPDATIFVGYTKPGESALHAAAAVTQGQIAPWDGRHLRVGDALYAALPGDTDSSRVLGIEVHLNPIGTDHCVYDAALSSAPVGHWQIWVSGAPHDALDGALDDGVDDAVFDAVLEQLRAPTPAQAARLRAYRPHCIFQGDYPEELQPPCARAELLAVSDLDDDGNLEFWYSEPYAWDTGFGVLEETGSGPEVLFAVCPGCAD